jgi:hypothetical protein
MGIRWHIVMNSSCLDLHVNGGPGLQTERKTYFWTMRIPESLSSGLCLTFKVSLFYVFLRWLPFQFLHFDPTILQQFGCDV